jgi:hypothetical protein
MITLTFNYRAGAIITFTREDGRGPGDTRTFPATDGWTVKIQDEGCVEVSNYKIEKEPSRIVPWHRIWEIRTI